MERDDMIMQLQLLRELCFTQIDVPGAHPMWAMDVEALDQAIAELESGTGEAQS